MIVAPCLAPRITRCGEAVARILEKDLDTLHSRFSGEDEHEG